MPRIFLVLALGLAFGSPQLTYWGAGVFDVVLAAVSTDAGGQFDPDGAASTHAGNQFDPNGATNTDAGGMFDPNG